MAPESRDASPLIRVERLVPGGEGFARHTDGRSIFIPRSFPGDLILPVQTTAKKSWSRIESFELKQASAQRRTPPCADAEACGGCDWMPLGETEQLLAKTEILKDALRRVGKFSEDDFPQVTAHESVRLLGYRERVRLQVRGGRLGFFSSRSHHLVEIERCHVARVEVWELVVFLRELMATQRDLFRPIAEIEIRALTNQPVESAPLQQDSDGAEAEKKFRGARLSLFLFPVRASRATRGKTASGASKAGRVQQKLDELLAQLENVTYPQFDVGVFGGIQPEQPWQIFNSTEARLPVGGFSQVNPEVNRQLIEFVLQSAPDQGTVLDLYCGAGNFSFPLAERGLDVLGVELPGASIQAAARWAAKVSSPVSFRAGDALEVAMSLADRGQQFDFVVVDPPRSGARGLAPALRRLTRQGLVLIGCDPVAFARDLRTVVEQGFSLKRLELFNMFPQTHHFESVALLKPDAESAAQDSPSASLDV
ncbi:MAG: methyltransferase domain-containing protein [Polyangiaceae bacterium]|nr:methyltransferase domain-containing protein [Polyangiaceae bacterium]